LCREYYFIDYCPGKQGNEYVQGQLSLRFPQTENCVDPSFIISVEDYSSSDEEWEGERKSNVNRGKVSKKKEEVEVVTDVEEVEGEMEKQVSKRKMKKLQIMKNGKMKNGKAKGNQMLSKRKKKKKNSM
jgi:hypothetical protein